MNKIATLRLQLRLIVFLSLTSWLGATGSYAFDAWHLSASDIKVGMPYWISFVSADHKNLSTELTSVTKANGYSNDYSTSKLSIQQIDFTDLRQHKNR